MSDAAEIREQVDVIRRMLSGALGVPIEGDPDWFREKATERACDFESGKSVKAFMDMLNLEYAELRRLAGGSNGRDG